MSNASVTKQFNEEKYKLYKSRAIVYFVLFAIVLTTCVILGFNVFSREEVKPINYTDSGVVDYRVYLKENDFYTEKFLPKGKSYVTNLIDYIDVNYNYNFSIDDLANVDFEYKVIGNLIIEDNNSKKELLNKQYDITEDKKNSIKATNEFVINEKFQINYDEYNKLANQFRSSNGIDTNSYLRVYLNIKRSTSSDSNYSFENEIINIDELKIPLSERAIDINIDTNSNTITNQVKFNDKNSINYIIIGIMVVLLLISIYFLKVIIVSIKKMNRKRSAYDKYVEKMLKEYDRLIVETKNIIDLEKYNIIKVSQFSELLDVRDNLKIPINYYCIEKHIKGLFYIKSDNDIYALYLNIDTIEKD